MKYLLFLLTAMQLSYFSAQEGNAAVVYSGKLLFINAIPTGEYTVIGKTKCPGSKAQDATAAGDNTGMQKVVYALDAANKKVGKGKLENYEAAIVHAPNNIELINFNDGGVTSNTQCTVNSKDYLKKKCGSKYIYLMIEPAREYTVAASIEVKNFTNIGQLKMGKNDMDNFINKLYERACKEAKDGLDFDAIVFYEKNMTISTGFLTGRTIQLVKFK